MGKTSKKFNDNLSVEENTLVKAPEAPKDVADDSPIGTVTPFQQFEAPTPTVAVDVVIEPKPARDTIPVDKEFLYRMIIALARGITTTFTGQAVINRVIGGLFNVEETAEKNKIYSEINKWVCEQK
jgi:hypothetical protein